MRSKRGGENLTLQSIMTLIFVAILFAALILFLVNNANGNLARKQILAKQLCLNAITAKPGTIINVTFSGSIERKANGFLIKKDRLDMGYYYPCYGNFSVTKEGKDYLIHIE